MNLRCGLGHVSHSDSRKKDLVRSRCQRSQGTLGGKLLIGLSLVRARCVRLGSLGADLESSQGQDICLGGRAH